ncbi:DUF5682 family protein [Streptomyces sp. 8N616]|uniref:DUF5682 family protein n=1 Tax=Streptomyces sp. 8N616 TaxID=3457414 RepID=UPI003FD46A9A
MRHHGPGSARAVREALDRHRPQAVLIEGPPEADTLVALAADENMRPPVALLAHVADDPACAAFWPLAEFSPEWVAIRWALAHGAEVRFIDLPAAHTLALSGSGEDGALAPGSPEQPDREPAAEGDGTTEERLRIDPLAVLAEAAGYDDPERWWEDAVEHRTPGDPTDRARTAHPPADAAPSPRAAADPDGPRTHTTHEPSGVETAQAGQAPPGRTAGAERHGPGSRGDVDSDIDIDVAECANRRDVSSGGGDRSGPRSGSRDGSWTGGGEREGGESSAAGPAGVGPHPAASGGDRGSADAAAAGSALGAFEALAEAMGALRETYGDGGYERDAVREAHMRLRIRDARRAFGDRFAVVCGAWHVPALTRRTTATADRQLVRGLPKAKVELTWVPWTHRRLSRHSGYGAGIASPGWYGHLFNAPDRPIERWMTKVAGLLRDEDHPVSSAHVIEAVRLADTLAAMRGRPLAGLAETTDAVRAVMCEGSDVPLALIRDRLVVGDVLGQVPDSAPAVPLQRDLTRAQRTLRIKPEAAERELELDLRKDTDAGRSRLLHRLRILGIAWGEPVASRGGLGTFRESWRLRWEPELSVRVAEAGVWGTTVSAAATAKAESEAASAASLAEVTALAERCLLAGLPDALPVVMRVLADLAALDPDVGHLAQALPALVRSVRYGDVRGTDSAALTEVATGLAERIFVGLPPACAGLDADGAAEMRRHVDSVHTAVSLLSETAAESDTARRSEPALRERWVAVLGALARRDGVGGVIRGRAGRLLLDDGRLAESEAARLMGLALSPGTAPAEAAAWIEGFVGGGAGGGMLLVHDERLLGLIDAWLTGVPAESFTDVLPLLRRTFAAYEPGVRRTLGELVRRGPEGHGGAVGGAAGGAAVGTVRGFGPGLDPDRADAVLPTLRLLLGRDDNDLVEVGR